MCCGGAGAGIFVKFSRLFVKMSMKNCKLSGLKDTLPPNLKMRRQKDHLSVRKWRRMLLFLCILLACTVGSICWFLSFDDGAMGRIQHCIDSEEDQGQVLLQHCNVSEKQLHALSSLFSESDQMASLEFLERTRSQIPQTDSMTCALEVKCLKKQESQTQGRWVGDVESGDRCPVHIENIPGKLDQSLPDEFVSLSHLQCRSSVMQDFRKNMLQAKEVADCTEDHYRMLFFSLAKGWWCLLIGIIGSLSLSVFSLKHWWNPNKNLVQLEPMPQPRQQLLQTEQHQLSRSPPKGAGKLRNKLHILFILLGMLASACLFFHLRGRTIRRREETLTNMCEERARMLQDQFNVSMNHVHALALLVSTFHHGKSPSAISQKTFGEYTERTAFERPLTSGVAYALKVLHSEREQFEKQHGWTIKNMETEDQTLVQDCTPENLDPAPIRDEYAPVIFCQETVSHIVSIDMMSGKEDRENILRARATGKGVLTPPFKLLKSNHLGVVLTFAVYDVDLPPHATPEERNAATMGYLGAAYDVPSLVEKLLHQLASKQTIVVNVYDTTNASAPILMYGTDIVDTGRVHVSKLDFGDPSRKHEMHCRFKQKPPLPWTAINASMGVLVITFLVGHILHAAIRRIAKVEEGCREMMELKARAEAADIAKSQFLATVSHEIRTPMNGVLGMLQMLMDTNLDDNQMDFAQTAHASGRDLISLINEVLDQAKIESCRLELEAVPFDLRSNLDNILSLFSGKCNEKGIELAVYVSDQLPDVVIGDPGRFRQIITNLVGNSIKFTHDKGHVFVTVHLADEVRSLPDVRDSVLKQSLNLTEDQSNTLSGFPVVNRWKSWEKFKKLNNKDTMERPEMIRLLVTVEDTGVGIPVEAHQRIFTPFMQADSSTSRTHGGTGIGLSISSRLVDLMAGEIGFESEPGTGSTFSFTVSFRKGQPSSLDPRQQPCDPAAIEFQGWRALVIDKRSVRVEVTRYHLRRLGMTVDVASSLKSAFSSLTSRHYLSAPEDLKMVLVDKDVWHKETVIAFHHLLKKTKQNGGREIPVGRPKIFLLATTISPEERSELKSAGLVDNFLIKPLRLSVLISCFQEALGSGKKITRKEPTTLQNLLREKRILVVDDNMVNRRVAEGALKKYGAIVTCVESGKASIELLKPPHNFDACFMDFQMPEMDGFEATRRIRAVEKQVNEQIASGEASVEMFGNVVNWHVPILAMTADVIQATSEDCLKCGMDDYVSKPFDEEKLYNAVAPFLSLVDNVD